MDSSHRPQLAGLLACKQGCICDGLSQAPGTEAARGPASGLGGIEATGTEGLALQLPSSPGRQENEMKVNTEDVLNLS